MAWRGMSPITGKTVTDSNHIAQSIRDILTTPVGSRVMRRDYGSQLFRLIDQPLNATTRMRLQVAVISALLRWEPRITVQAVTFDAPTVDGGQAIRITYQRTDTSSAPGVVDIPLRSAA